MFIYFKAHRQNPRPMTTQQCLYLPIKAFSSVICKEQQPGNTYTARHADLPVCHLQAPLL
jgi:hypothetical protein